jgi:hypothetical protein
MTAWASAPFEQFLDYVCDENRILRTCKSGLIQTRDMVGFIKALSKYKVQEENITEIEATKMVNVAVRQSEFAQQEIEKNFPLLHAHALISHWSALEALIQNIMISWFINVPDVLKSDTFRKIKISLADFECLDKNERMQLLFYDLEQHIKAKSKYGVDRFEVLLDTIDLSGSIDQDVKQSIYELSQVRNIIVHRASIADRKLVENCPWLNLAIGEIVIINSEKYHNYSEAMSKYVWCLLERVTLRLNIPISNFFHQKGKAASCELWVTNSMSSSNES